jgi:hypothetical protein
MPEVEEEGYDVMGVFTGNIDMRSVGTERLVAVYSCVGGCAPPGLARHSSPPKD